jgi:LacI family transcriptional regulator, galactose operon repressor
MKDIARDLGVSVITISKVLRNHPDIGDETRERVLARVKELDYRANFAARSLLTGRSYLVGLVVPDQIANRRDFERAQKMKRGLNVK